MSQDESEPTWTGQKSAVSSAALQPRPDGTTQLLVGERPLPVVSASPVKPVSEQRGKDLWPLVHECMARAVYHCQGGVRIALE